MASNRPRAVFMAFGTKGDVYPIAAIAAALACDQLQYRVVLVTHAAHENLSEHLAAKHVSLIPVLSPPVLSIQHDHDSSDPMGVSFSLQKRNIEREHRQGCLSAMQKIFGEGPSMEGDFIVINFFALEGWNLAELFRIRCVVAAPYVFPYSAPSSFERRFRKDLPLLYKYLQEAPQNKVCWKDVAHWMWPLFTEEWGSWRSGYLNLSPCPFTDPVTGLPMWHDRAESPVLLYGFSQEVVECPGYWASNIHVCGFWFVPMEWQFSCKRCREISAVFSSGHLDKKELCGTHVNLQYFLETPNSCLPIFIGLSSIGSMGFLRNPRAFLLVIRAVLERTSYRFILLSAGYEPLEATTRVIEEALSGFPEKQQHNSEDGILLFNDRLFCFSGMIPYSWLFPRCAVAVHHGGSGSTAAALHAGIPQIICPFMLDQFYWAERMFWLGVAPEPLQKSNLLPEKDDKMSIEQAASALSNTIKEALSPKTKACANKVAERISLEDGVAEAVKVLKEDIINQTKPKD